VKSEGPSAGEKTITANGVTCEQFEDSLTRLAVRYTQVDEDLAGHFAVSQDRHRLLAEELRLGTVPDWAREIITRMLGSPLAPCGHYTFPAPVAQVTEAIGAERCPAFVIGCYTADPARKRRLQAVIYCLDAWHHDAPIETAAWELERRETDGKDWPSIVCRVYVALGDRTELRLLLVERLIHRLRWWVKSHSWMDDPRTAFGLDQYLGDLRGDGDWGDFGDPELRDPYFVELREPDVVKAETRIRQEVPDGTALLDRIHSTWLCAPKVFRYIERLIHEVGGVGSGGAPDYKKCLLDCEDTYPDFGLARQWESDYLDRLSRWLRDDTDAVPELGSPTPVKQWLVGLLKYRLELMIPWTRFIAGHPSGHSGTAPLLMDAV